MTVRLFTFVEMFSRTLVTADHLLDRGATHAEDLGQDREAALDWRLIETMHPLRFQIMVVCNFARQWPARAAGLPVPESIDDTLDLAGFKAALAEGRAFLAGLSEDQFEGRDEVPITFRIGEGMEPTLPAERWITSFATTNIYFHLSTAYGILRARGADLGKVDLFAGGL